MTIHSSFVPSKIPRPPQPGHVAHNLQEGQGTGRLHIPNWRSAAEVVVPMPLFRRLVYTSHPWPLAMVVAAAGLATPCVLDLLCRVGIGVG
ncbi:hypothetical protein VTK26DRAFT_2680 [Humicola hyalothermophila]